MMEHVVERAQLVPNAGDASSDEATRDLEVMVAWYGWDVSFNRYGIVRAEG